jgi:hypothetical protein
MTLWISVGVMPNIQVKAPVGSEIAALVPLSDKCVQAINRTYKNHDKFVNSFRDQFGRKHSPSVLILNRSCSKRFFYIDAITSFRDILAISIVSLNRSRLLKYGHSTAPLYSLSFNIYPWHPNKDYKFLLAINPGVMALDEIGEFQGQTFPELPPLDLTNTDIDWPLFEKLTNHWKARYSAKKPEPSDLQLMRSLHLAYYACQLPSPNPAIALDAGRILAFWVSAFETLVHPRTSDVKKSHVQQALDKFPWKHRRLNRKSFTHTTKKGYKIKLTLPSLVYEKMHNDRSEFLHGEPLSKDWIKIKGSKRPVLDFSASLYRMLLTSILDMCPNFGVDTEMDLSEQDYKHWLKYIQPQLLAEEAISMARPYRDRISPRVTVERCHYVES